MGAAGRAGARATRRLTPPPAGPCRPKPGWTPRGWYLDQLGTFGDPRRDTRGRVVSVAHVALERSDELTLAPGGSVSRAEWVPVRSAPPSALAFDHADDPAAAMNRIQSKLRYSWVAFQLLPERFTLPELRAVYAAILDPAIGRLNTSNFKKAFAALFASGELAPGGPARRRRAASAAPAISMPLPARWPEPGSASCPGMKGAPHEATVMRRH